MNPNRIATRGNVVTTLAMVEYAAILGLGIWAGWYRSTGALGDMPFELLLIPLSLIAIAMGYACFRLVTVRCLRSGDAPEAARASGALAAAIAPWLSASTVLWCNFTPVQIASGFVLALRRKLTAHPREQR